MTINRAWYAKLYQNFESSSMWFYPGKLPHMILSSLPLELQEIEEDVPWVPVMRSQVIGKSSFYLLSSIRLIARWFWPIWSVI